MGSVQNRNILLSLLFISIAALFCYLLLDAITLHSLLDVSVASNNMLDYGYCSYIDIIKYGVWIDLYSTNISNARLSHETNQLLIKHQYNCPSAVQQTEEQLFDCPSGHSLSYVYYIDTHCRLFHFFYPIQFLNLINNTNLFIIGDSQSWQHYLELICRLSAVDGYNMSVIQSRKLKFEFFRV
eukprot:718834_1